MKQREVTDQHGTTWTCVQAYAGVDSAAAEQATELAQAADGSVTVVCTPSGGAQTKRLDLAADWLDSLTDDELKNALDAA
ncbi:hypothetical protein F0P96_13890 [Hymenobacter busanensis]|uniref:Uncharacterized protein n=2 Tax=Hymenobacter busanensis TaxID=2607656 RepID=A0A7L5A3D1_9BACT|nr:hypothetical protein F0P96_13890 [Hymenobacter busanensis]QHJ09716.1 hypothetical protein GUY19_14815 [Hymenobacter busanensis]